MSQADVRHVKCNACGFKFNWTCRTECLKCQSPLRPQSRPPRPLLGALISHGNVGDSWSGGGERRSKRKRKQGKDEVIGSCKVDQHIAALVKKDDLEDTIRKAAEDKRELDKAAKAPYLQLKDVDTKISKAATAVENANKAVEAAKASLVELEFSTNALIDNY